MALPARLVWGELHFHGLVLHPLSSKGAGKTGEKHGSSTSSPLARADPAKNARAPSSSRNKTPSPAWLRRSRDPLRGLSRASLVCEGIVDTQLWQLSSVGPLAAELSVPGLSGVDDNTTHVKKSTQCHGEEGEEEEQQSKGAAQRRPRASNEAGEASGNARVAGGGDAREDASPPTIKHASHKSRHSPTTPEPCAGRDTGHFPTTAPPETQALMRWLATSRSIMLVHCPALSKRFWIHTRNQDDCTFHVMEYKPCSFLSQMLLEMERCNAPNRSWKPGAAQLEAVARLSSSLPSIGQQQQQQQHQQQQHKKKKKKKKKQEQGKEEETARPYSVAAVERTLSRLERVAEKKTKQLLQRRDMLDDIFNDGDENLPFKEVNKAVFPWLPLMPEWQNLHLSPPKTQTSATTPVNPQAELANVDFLNGKSLSLTSPSTMRVASRLPRRSTQRIRFDRSPPPEPPNTSRVQTMVARVRHALGELLDADNEEAKGEQKEQEKEQEVGMTMRRKTARGKSVGAGSDGSGDFGSEEEAGGTEARRDRTKSVRNFTLSVGPTSPLGPEDVSSVESCRQSFLLQHLTLPSSQSLRHLRDRSCDSASAMELRKLSSNADFSSPSLPASSPHSSDFRPMPLTASPRKSSSPSPSSTSGARARRAATQRTDGARACSHTNGYNNSGGGGGGRDGENAKRRAQEVVGGASKRSNSGLGQQRPNQAQQQRQQKRDKASPLRSPRYNNKARYARAQAGLRMSGAESMSTKSSSEAKSTQSTRAVHVLDDSGVSGGYEHRAECAGVQHTHAAKTVSPRGRARSRKGTMPKEKHRSEEVDVHALWERTKPTLWTVIKKRLHSKEDAQRNAVRTMLYKWCYSSVVEWIAQHRRPPSESECEQVVQAQMDIICQMADFFRLCNTQPSASSRT